MLDYSFGAASFVMPNLLSKLEADVLVVNPYANTAGAITFDRRASAARVADLVAARGPTWARCIDPGGEHLTLVDDEGHVLTDDEALLVMLELVTDAQPGARVALPVAVQPGGRGDLRGGPDAEIVWTKLAASHLMEVASAEGVILRGQPDGGFIFPGFLPAFDAAATLVNLLALLARTGQPLSELVGTAAQGPHRPPEVDTPWEQKGTVMRTLVERLPRDGTWSCSTGSRCSSPTAGRWSSPTPRSRSPTSGPRRPATPRPGPGPRSTPSGSASSCARSPSARPRPVRRGGVPGHRPHLRPCRVCVRIMNIPDDLRYSSDHEWIRSEGDRVRVGITDYAQDALGDMVYVELPAGAPPSTAGGTLGEVESTKSVSEIYAPVAGEVVR